MFRLMIAIGIVCCLAGGVAIVYGLYLAVQGPAQTCQANGTGCGAAKVVPGK